MTDTGSPATEALGLDFGLQWEHTVSDFTASSSHNFNDNLVIGRAEVAHVLGFEDPMLSRKHIELHPIVFDTAETDVAPLLYVKCLSRNSIDVLVFSLDPDFPFKIKLSRNSPAHLLGDGDMVLVSPVVHLTVRLPRRAEDSLTPLQREEISLLDSRYLVTPQVIGSGAHGTVMVAFDILARRQLACKVVDLHSHARTAMHTACSMARATNPSNHFTMGYIHSKESYIRRIRCHWQTNLQKYLGQCKAELAIHGRLSHPNIASVAEAHVTTHSIYIFQELITGGDLYSYVDSKGHGLSDAETAVIIRQVLEAVKYLHENGIVHRDIKPENIQMTAWHSGGRIVLNDFGLAKRFDSDKTDPAAKPSHRMHTELGTWDYAAPEIGIHSRHRCPGGYDASVDIWAVGAVTAMLLTAELISKSLAPGEYNARRGYSDARLLEYDLSALDREQHPIWGGIAARPKSFVRCLLAHDPSERPTAAQALRHSWFTKRLYRKQMDSIYQKATASWRPSVACEPRAVDTSHLGPGPMEDESILEDM